MNKLKLCGTFKNEMDASKVLRHISFEIRHGVTSGVFRADTEHKISWELEIGYDDSDVYFNVLRLNRDDITTEFAKDCDFFTEQYLSSICALITDEEMTQVAEKVGKTLTGDECYWLAIRSVVEDMGLIEKYQAECPTDEFITEEISDIVTTSSAESLMDIPGVEAAVREFYAERIKEKWQAQLKEDEEAEDKTTD